MQSPRPPQSSLQDRGRHGASSSPSPKPHPPSSRRPVAGETTLRSPDGNVLKRLQFLTWPCVVTAAAAATPLPAAATAPTPEGSQRGRPPPTPVVATPTPTAAFLGEASRVYPVSVTPAPGCFTPDGAYHYDARVDYECFISASTFSRSSRVTGEDAAKASHQRVVAALLTRLQREVKAKRRRTKDKRRRQDFDEIGFAPSDSDGDDDEDGDAIPKWLQDAAANIGADAFDGEGASRGGGMTAVEAFTEGISWTESAVEDQAAVAQMTVEVDLWGAYSKTAVDEAGQQHASTRMWLKRCSSALPADATALVAIFRRLVLDETSIVDVRMHYPFNRLTTSLQTIVKSALRAGAAGSSTSNPRRAGEGGQYLICNAPDDVADYVYAYCVSHLSQNRPLDATSPRLFRPGGVGVRLLPTPSDLLATISSHPSEQTSAAWDAPLRATERRRSSSIKLSSSRKLSVSYLQNPDTLTGLPQAMEHRRRISSAPATPWYVDEAAARREAMELAGTTAKLAVGTNFRRNVVKIRSALALKRAEQAAEQDELRYDYDGKRADLSSFDLPPLPQNGWE